MKLNLSKVITETSFHYGFILNAELIQSVFSGKGIQVIKFLYSCKKREIFIIVVLFFAIKADDDEQKQSRERRHFFHRKSTFFSTTTNCLC